MRPDSATASLRRTLLIVAAFFLAVGSTTAVSTPAAQFNSVTAARSAAVGDDTEITDARLHPVGAFNLPGPPLGMTFRSATDGWFSFASGQIAHFTITGGKLDIKTVNSELAQPRSIVYSNGRVFISDIKVPCGKVAGFVRCSAADFPGEWPGPAQFKILKESEGIVVSYKTAPDGSLSDRRNVVEDLPVATSDHAPNGLAVGPDGYIYLVMGSVDVLYNRPDLVKQLPQRKQDLLGSVVRFRPDGSGFERFARGIRNVYGLTFGDGGALYGVDNDGPTMHGYRGEEVIHFRQNKNYGYPYEGSYGPFTVATDGPIWILRSTGSAGIAWAPKVGLPPGLLVGSCAQLIYVRIRVETGRPWSRNDEQLLRQTNGCTPTVVGGPDGRLYVGTVFPNKLLIFTASVGNLAPQR